MKHLVYLAIAAGALAVMGCGGAAPPKPADPPAPTAAKYSCGDGYVFDSDQVPGPEGAVVNDVFYWGSSTSGAARCYSATRNNSMVGRVESNAGDATGATVMSVTLSDELRWYFILEFSDGTYCSAATAGDGRATCFATVKRDATGFRVDDLPAVPLPVPEGAPERPPGVPESPPGGPGPGGGDQGGGHTGAPEPEEPAEEDPVEEEPYVPAPPPGDYSPWSTTCSMPGEPPAGWEAGWREGDTISGCVQVRVTIDRITGFSSDAHPYVSSIFANISTISTGFSSYHGFTGVRAHISKEISLGDRFKITATGDLTKRWPVRSSMVVENESGDPGFMIFECSYFKSGQNGECGTDEQGNPSKSSYPHKDAWRSLVGVFSLFHVECRWSATVGVPTKSSFSEDPPGTIELYCR